MSRSANNIMKVDDIKLMISTLSLQEIYNSFMSIIDRIFITDNTDNYWDLTSRNSYKNDNEKILEFLSPNGHLLDLILKRLTVDKSVIHFEFPIHRLSRHTQTLIASNAAPMFITSKLYSKNHGLQNSVLFLNAFEYFMFSFISYIYHPNITKRIEWNGSTDSIYCQLVLRYFDFFFFNVRDSYCLMQLALQSRSRTNLNQSFSWISPHTYQPQQNHPINLSNSTSELMFNRSRLAGSKDHKNIDIAELYYTDAVLQIIAEFWLNSIIEPTVANSPAMMDASVIVGGSAGISGTQQLVSRPSVDQVCLVRVLVKHCYHFCYAKSVITLSPDCQLECEFLSKLHVYRQQIIPRFLLSKMLSYLETCFRTWPIDLSFKIVMETWLSVVQPWRYVDSYQHPNENETSLPMAAIASGSINTTAIPEEWSEFVTHNYELYTTLLLQFVYRLQRMDLAVARNAQMMYRVAKVLGQCDLAKFLAAANDSRFRSGQTMDLVWNDIRYQMSLAFLDINSLLSRLEDSDQSSQKSWWKVVWDSLNSDLLSSNNPKRAIMYLRQSRTMFSDLLGIDCGHEDVSRVAERHDFLDHKNSQPDHIITNNGIQLTEFGRFQVVNKLCKLSIPSNIDYYNRPTCSYEVDALVRLARGVSHLVCNKYEDQLKVSCYRSDFLGRLSRYIFIGKRRPVGAISNVDNALEHACIDNVTSVDHEAQQLQQWVDAHPLHLRLRFLTTKAFLFWFFLAYVILRFAFGFGVLSMVGGGAVIYLVVAMSAVVLFGFQ